MSWVLIVLVSIGLENGIEEINKLLSGSEMRAVVGTIENKEV